jgi:hypothetical protein
MGVKLGFSNRRIDCWYEAQRGQAELVDCRVRQLDNSLPESEPRLLNSQVMPEGNFHLMRRPTRRE